MSLDRTDRRRWDTDERYVGARDASVLSGDVARLLEQTREDGWVTEDAEAHLAPSIRAVAESMAVDLARLEAIDDILEVDIRLPEGSGATAQMAVAFAIVGSFAEMTTHIRQNGAMPGGVDLLVVTGMLPEGGAFATHGHLVRVRVLVDD
jgi:hypothetical protein